MRQPIGKLFNLILIILFSILTNHLYAQIKIEANTSVSGQKFLIEINENSDKYFLILKIKDSISTSKRYEKEMERYLKKYFLLKDQSIKNDNVKLILEEMNTLIDKNTYYSTTKTEILKTEYYDFDALINLFKKESIAFFEKREQNKNRIVLDGTSVNIKVSNNGYTKTIWSHSPREKSHPEINNLITSTLEIFRNKKFLSEDKAITVGY